MVLRWGDKKDVNVLTTLHKPQVVNAKTRTSVKKKPTAIVDYNNYMGGVDHSDQMIAYNPFHRKTVKWWKKLFPPSDTHLGAVSLSVPEGDDLLTIPNRRDNEEQPTRSEAVVPQTPDHLRLQVHLLNGGDNTEVALLHDIAYGSSVCSCTMYLAA
ncbi:hypothetical protein C0Q70_14508 [Pomacea canaliculata]|uniref:PiggyBac transposable element-derived protein domain-containing protein n=1 Tax=Pomacea canaliculata TaxID=400727 RepID=A0A2T7NS85_POMCA|nr:hypothetical protein C0Q70_14508 [Pomacea canaliculata]